MVLSIARMFTIWNDIMIVKICPVKYDKKKLDGEAQQEADDTNEREEH